MAHTPLITETPYIVLWLTMAGTLACLRVFGLAAASRVAAEHAGVVEDLNGTVVA